MIRNVLLAGAAGLALAAGCGPGRTSAATQPTPAAFDPSTSQPEALALVANAEGDLGSPTAWQAVKQLAFTVKYVRDGEVKGHYVHHWDRWNGRHNFKSVDFAAPQEEGPTWVEVFYDLFDNDAKPHANYNGREVSIEDARKFRGDARTRLAEDGYMFTMLHKLRDPGVKLEMGPEMAEGSGVCAGGCATLKVTFDPAVGKDTWFVNYNKATKLPEVIAKQTANGQIGYVIQGWVEAGGLKFPAKLQNIGFAGEVFEFSDVSIGDPDDRLYIPQVTGG